jgi:hypothetical protein
LYQQGQKQPWANLSPADRKRDFESRLADALTVLLLIAAKASLYVKKRALQKHRESRTATKKEDLIYLDQRMYQKMERKFQHLVRTCSWETDATTAEVRMHAMPIATFKSQRP